MTRAAVWRCCLMLATALCAHFALAGQADASCGDWLSGHRPQEATSAESSRSPVGDAADERRWPARPCSGPECRQSQPTPAAPPAAPQSQGPDRDLLVGPHASLAMGPLDQAWLVAADAGSAPQSMPTAPKRPPRS